MSQPYRADADGSAFDFRHIEAELARGYSDPFFIIDARLVREKARRFRAAMPRVFPHYAVKVNPATEILAALHDEGVGFEIASRAELDVLLGLGVPAHEILYSNPIKSHAYLTHAIECGVTWYVIDAIEELHKVHAAKPDANLYLRIHTSNEGSVWKLSNKFGAFEDEAEQLIAEAARIGAGLAGVGFHVGSQCKNIQNWPIGIRASRETFEKMKAVGLEPRFLNLSGGFPVSMGDEVPSIEEIGKAVNRELENISDSVHVVAEPGRFMVADTGVFVCQVIGTATRDGKRWLYLDAGIHRGLGELSNEFRFTIHTDRDGPNIPWTVAGPTCDGLDVCMTDQPLPQGLQAGDFIYVHDHGAYSAAYANTFNGFPIPNTVVVNAD
ncbi:MAG: type III PLP-dependent enzyme [Myxococcales bacterium]|nr:type III PLP-dependent enzyme [Myxococcales bacterium]